MLTFMPLPQRMNGLLKAEVASSQVEPKLQSYAPERHADWVKPSALHFSGLLAKASQRLGAFKRRVETTVKRAFGAVKEYVKKGLKATATVKLAIRGVSNRNTMKTKSFAKGNYSSRAEYQKSAHHGMVGIANRLLRFSGINLRGPAQAQLQSVEITDAASAHDALDRLMKLKNLNPGAFSDRKVQLAVREMQATAAILDAMEEVNTVADLSDSVKDALENTAIRLQQAEAPGLQLAGQELGKHVLALPEDVREMIQMIPKEEADIFDDAMDLPVFTNDLLLQLEEEEAQIAAIVQRLDQSDYSTTPTSERITSGIFFFTKAARVLHLIAQIVDPSSATVDAHPMDENMATDDVSNELNDGEMDQSDEQDPAKIRLRRTAEEKLAGIAANSKPVRRVLVRLFDSLPFKPSTRYAIMRNLEIYHQEIGQMSGATLNDGKTIRVNNRKAAGMLKESLEIAQRAEPDKFKSPEVQERLQFIGDMSDILSRFERVDRVKDLPGPEKRKFAELLIRMTNSADPGIQETAHQMAASAGIEEGVLSRRPSKLTADEAGQ